MEYIILFISKTFFVLQIFETYIEFDDVTDLIDMKLKVVFP